MFEINQHIGNYPIKRVLAPEGDIQRYLSEDPFFNSSITLNVLDIRSFSQEQKHQLFSVLQKLFLLEGQAISPVFDSGFEADYIFYTNGRDQKRSLLQKLESEISFEECLFIIKNLATALRLAAEKNMTHGFLSVNDIYFNKGYQPFIENFGVKHYFSAIKNNIKTDYSIKDSLHDIDKIIRRLKNNFSEEEKNNEDYISNLNGISKFLIDESKNNSKDFKDLENKIDEILSIPSTDIILTSNVEQDSYNINNREEVLPFIRSVIEERNKLKILLVEEKKINEKLSYENKKYLDKIEFINTNLDSENIKKEKNSKKIFYIFITLSFLLGNFVCYFSLNSIMFDRVDNIKDRAKIVYSSPKKDILPDMHIPEDKASVIEPENVNIDTASNPQVDIKIEEEIEKTPDIDIPQVQEKAPQVTEKIPEVTWLPVGQEFETKNAPSVSSTEVEPAEAGDIFSQILGWSSAWEKQDVERYLSFYNKSFRPGGGKSLAEWKKIRRSRLQLPDWIKITIQDINITKITAKKIHVEFQQIYQSNSYRDEGKKVMAMELTDGHWLIQSEKSL